MTHRFIRSLAGVTVVTGLALTLACGGNDDDDVSIVNSAITNLNLNIADYGVTKHHYVLTANAVGGSNIKYTPTSSVGGSAFEPVSGRSNMWYYTPAGAGLNIITVDASNADGTGKVTADTFISVSPDTPPELSLSKTNLNGSQVYTVNVAVGGTSSVTLPAYEPIDKDSVAWSVTPAGDFIDKQGTVSIDGSKLIIAANSAAAGEYSFTGLKATETGAGIPSSNPINTPYTIKVIVGGTSGGGDGGTGQANITAYPEGHEVIQGVPFRYQFSAASNDGVNRDVIGWEVNDGVGPNSMGPAPGGPDRVTIDQNGRMTINLPIDPDDPYYVRDGYLTLQLGVKAILSGNVSAYQSIRMNVRRNTAPTVYNYFGRAGTIKTTVNITPTGADRETQWMPVYEGLDQIWFKGATPNSLDLSSRITLPSVAIYDPDVKNDDDVIVTLKSVTVNGVGTDGVDITDTVKPWLVNGGNLIRKNATEGNITLNDLETTYLPVSGSEALQYVIGRNTQTLGNVGTDGDIIYFNYTVTDLAGQLAPYHTSFAEGEITISEAAKEGLSFSISARVQGNTSPVIDNYYGQDGWTASHGDKKLVDGGWVDLQAKGDATSQWTLNYDKNSSPLKVTDYNLHPIFLKLEGVPVVTVEENGVTTTPAGNAAYIEPNKLVDPISALPWKISWKPTVEQERGKYTFGLMAWDKYGAAAFPTNISGLVYGTVTGANVNKTILGATAPNAAAANFAMSGGWASIKLNPFYSSEMARYQNQYGYDIKDDTGKSIVTWTFDSPGTTNPAWTVNPVPPGYYIVSAGEKANNNPVITPVVGPAVTNDGLTTGRSNTASVGFADDLVTYAYSDQKVIDLSTNVPFGRLSETLDKSIASGLYGNSVHTSTTTVSGTVVFRGRFVGVGAGSIADGDVFQLSIPTNNQKRFIYPPLPQGDNTRDNTYPSAVYSNALGWNGTIPTADPETLISDEGHGYNPFRFDVPTNLLTIAATDSANFSVLKHNWATGTIQPQHGNMENVTYPYWKLDRSATVTGTTFGANTDLQTVIFAEETKQGADFNATIDRVSFKEAYKTSVPFPLNGSFTRSSMTDTLQVVSYPDTTAGPQYAQGLPTLLEFGSLTGAKQESGRDVVYDTFEDFVDLGTIKIPAPATWLGTSRPVVHYTVNFLGDTTATAKLGGSMGLVTTDTKNVIGLAQNPVTEVNITTKLYHATTARTLAAASDPISAFQGESGLEHPDPINYPVEARRYALDGQGEGSVFLSWKNPVGGKPFSGNIIEFYGVPASGTIAASATPLYKVHVGPEVESFPIPTDWAVKFENQGKEVIVRIKTVSYGEYNADPTVNTLVDFSKTPFKTALPYAWVDTLTTKVVFDGFVPAPEGGDVEFYDAKDVQITTANPLQVAVGDGIYDLKAKFLQPDGVTERPAVAGDVISWTLTSTPADILTHTNKDAQTTTIVAAGTTTGSFTLDVKLTPGDGTKNIEGRISGTVVPGATMTFAGTSLLINDKTLSFTTGQNVPSIWPIITRANDTNIIETDDKYYTWEIPTGSVDYVEIPGGGSVNKFAQTLKAKAATPSSGVPVNVTYENGTTKVEGTLTVIVGSQGTMTFEGPGIVDGKELTIRVGDTPIPVSPKVTIPGYTGWTPTATEFVWTNNTNTVVTSEAGQTTPYNALVSDITGIKDGTGYVTVAFTGDAPNTPRDGIQVTGTLKVNVTPGGTLAFRDGTTALPAAGLSVLMGAADKTITAVPTLFNPDIPVAGDQVWRVESSTPAGLVTIADPDKGELGFSTTKTGVAMIEVVYTNTANPNLKITNSFNVTVQGHGTMSIARVDNGEIVDGGLSLANGADQVLLKPVNILPTGATTALTPESGELDWTIDSGSTTTIKFANDDYVHTGSQAAIIPVAEGTDTITLQFERVIGGTTTTIVKTIDVEVNAAGEIKFLVSGAETTFLGLAANKVADIDLLIKDMITGDINPYAVDPSYIAWTVAASGYGDNIELFTTLTGSEQIAATTTPVTVSAYEGGPWASVKTDTAKIGIDIVTATYNEDKHVANPTYVPFSAKLPIASAVAGGFVALKNLATDTITFANLPTLTATAAASKSVELAPTFVDSTGNVITITSANAGDVTWKLSDTDKATFATTGNTGVITDDAKVSTMTGGATAKINTVAAGAVTLTVTYGTGTGAITMDFAITVS